MSYNERTLRLLGADAADVLARSSVILFGVGGVGSFAAEALCRSGVGRIALVDGDTVAESNLNRQLVALRSTVGESKVDVMARRMRDIREDILVEPIHLFYDQDTRDQIDLSQYGIILDAIDSLPSKLLIIESAHRLGIPVLSCMGAGNRLNPMGFHISPVSKTHTCPLARRMRRELCARGLGDTPVVWSDEMPVKPPAAPDGSHSPGSVAFVPSAAGLLMASWCVRRLLGLL